MSPENLLPSFVAMGVFFGAFFITLSAQDCKKKNVKTLVFGLYCSCIPVMNPTKTWWFLYVDVLVAVLVVVGFVYTLLTEFNNKALKSLVAALWVALELALSVHLVEAIVS